MASESKKRKAHHSFCENGAMKWDCKVKGCAMFHKRHRMQFKRETARETQLFIEVKQ